jgi:hypothetical protein
LATNKYALVAGSDRRNLAAPIDQGLDHSEHTAPTTELKREKTPTGTGLDGAEIILNRSQQPGVCMYKPKPFAPSTGNTSIHLSGAPGIATQYTANTLACQIDSTITAAAIDNNKLTVTCLQAQK